MNGVDKIRSPNGQKALLQNDGQCRDADRLTLRDDMGRVIVATDLWSAAYREAVESLGEQMDIATLQGKNVAHLFKELEDMTEEITHESAFMRGVKYLRSIQIAISLATADSDFAKQITEMLRQISYIDDCDTLGQKSEKNGIHKDLVQNATLDIVEDIRAMLYDHESDMGCGKTVAMTFLVDELSRRNEHQLPQPKICYYYCRDDETGEAVYILSALILFSGLKTILSSRPQEDVLEQLEEMGMARVELSSDARRDAIIVEKTVERQLSYLSADVKGLIIEGLSSRAQGSAIWTKMIVKLIEIRGIRAEKPMRHFLDQVPLPDELSKIYSSLFTRCTADDPENQDLASTALKLLAITHRPLSILELTWAVTLGANQHLSTVNALAKLVDCQRVMSLIHPFVTRVDFSDLMEPQVRLTHQSVKEFFRTGCFQSRPCLRDLALNNADHRSLGQGDESLEAFMLDICVRYLLLEEIGTRDLFSEEQVAIAELPQGVDLFDDDEKPVDYNPYCTWESWEEDMIRYDPTDRGFEAMLGEMLK
ncbi:hypothetical protein N8T08_001586 [Aspergillus melleus]|uniref:Uncharacterized protein n=1 Tax=Aspergillus melleus TaxID=138277 RepID=A0ACC3ANB7_9EURO|nr:hypothetical protein N8T08_001586 [Aspergillus melleus]